MSNELGVDKIWMQVKTMFREGSVVIIVKDNLGLKGIGKEKVGWVALWPGLTNIWLDV